MTTQRLDTTWLIRQLAPLGFRLEPTRAEGVLNPDFARLLLDHQIDPRPSAHLIRVFAERMTAEQIVAGSCRPRAITVRPTGAIVQGLNDVAACAKSGAPVPVIVHIEPAIPDEVRRKFAANGAGG